MSTSPDLIDFGRAFVGRADEIAAIDRAIERGARVITLFGTAGVGKTRLAVHYGLTRTNRPGRRTDAVTWFCDLSAARSADDLLGAMMRSFGISDESSSRNDASARVRDWIIARGRSMFVLDNFETVAEPGASLLARWSSQCPQAVFLVTSRHRLAIAGETLVPVEPLGVPHADERSSQVIANCDAVRFFLACLGASTDGIGLPEEHARLLADVVRKLDGLPLAIELAAARAELMTLPALNERLSARFDLLRDPSRPAEDRHATLQIAIDSSWELLKPVERAVFMQSSVFEGGLTLDAAEAVVRVPEGPGAPSVLDGVHGLCRKSLLRLHRPTSNDGEPRFTMLPTVREYATARLRASGDETATHDRFAERMLADAERWCEGVDGASGPAAHARLVAEYDNLQSVLRRALMTSPPTVTSVTQALRCAVALGPVFLFGGPLSTHRTVLDRALSLATNVTDPAVSRWIARATLARGTANRYLGETDAATQDLVRAAEMARDLGDASLEARASRVRAALLFLSGQPDEAQVLTESALDTFRASGEQAYEGEALSLLGLIAFDRGDFARARVLLEAALDVLRACGSIRYQAHAYSYLGTLCIETSDLANARRYHEAALELHRRLGNQRSAGAARGHLGIIGHLEGQLDEAEAAYAHALGVAREVGDRRLEGYYLYYTAMMALERGDPTRAGDLLERALDVLHAVRDRRYEAIVLSAVAAQRALAGRHVEIAAALTHAQRALAAANDASLARLDDAVRALIMVCSPAADTVERGVFELLRELSLVPSDETRLMLRVVQATLARRETHARTWSFGPGSRWVRSPDGATISLETRAIPARLLDALVTARLAQPGQPVPFDALVAAGWPGTKMSAAAANNRVHVALSTLRKAGLDALIIRVHDGYAIDPSIPVARADDEPPPA